MKKLKHDHKGTKILKLGIFASLMLAPLMAIGFKCAYVTFNKNAKDSYYGETINQETYNYISENTYSNTETYYYFFDTYSGNNTSFYVTNFNITNQGTLSDYNYNLISNNDIYRVYCDASQGLYTFYSLNNVFVTSPTLNQNFTASFNLTTITDYDLLHKFYTISYNKYSYLDNAFYYAIDQAMDSQYFAWARTSALYTPTSTMTQGMGINTNAVPTLLVYWLILTAVYVIVDIVIELFTYLTHMITSRLEE